MKIRRLQKLAGLSLALLLAATAAGGCSDKEPAASEPEETARLTTAAEETAGTGSETAGTEGDMTTTSGRAGGTQKPAGTTAATKKAETTQSSPGGAKHSFKQSSYISDAALWRTPLLRKSGFQFYNQIIMNGSAMNKLLVQATIEEYGLGEHVDILPHPQAWEWGYAANTFDPGPDSYTGWGSHVSENDYKLNPGKTRREALTKLKRFLNVVYKVPDGQEWTSNNGHYPYHHYAGEFGATVIGSEIGENIRNYQWQIALNRGAARQYQTPWTIAWSFWHGPGATSYEGKADEGHSISLYKRAMVMSYMAGTDVFAPEGGGEVSVKPNIKNGLYEISPHGEAVQQFVKFTKANSDVGVNYTPVALVMDYYHGSYMGGGNAKKAFRTFDYTAGDNMTWDLVDAIWPGAWTGASLGMEKSVMSNNQYGDYFDALLQNASQKVLNSYPALVMTGDVKLSAAEKKRYVQYVEQGGALFLNTAYLDQFPEYKGSLGSNGRFEKAAGKGKVVVYGADYKIDKLMPAIQEYLKVKVPFTLSTPVQQMLNIRDGYMYLTLINNEGVEKGHTTKPVVDQSKAKTVTVTYTGAAAAKSVKDIYAGRGVSVSGSKATVTIPPGESVILEYYLG